MNTWSFENKVQILAISFCLAWLGVNPAFAAQIEDAESLLVYEATDSHAKSSPQETDILVVEYDSKILPQENQSSKSRSTLREQYSRQMMAMASDNVHDAIYIPELPHDLGQFESLMHLSDHELEVFLSKKTAFMRRFARTLEALHLKKRTINRALLELNNKFGASSRLIANSNSIGGTAMFSLSAGLALPQKIVQSLKKTRVGRFVPQSGGFFYLLGFGAGFSRTKSAAGKSTWVLDLFLDTEKLKHTTTGIFEASAAGTYGVVYEHRDGEFHSQNNQTTYGGVTGVFRQGESQFGWAASTGFSFPPGIGALLVFTNQTTRHYLVRVSRDEGLRFPIVNSIKKFVSSWVQSHFGQSQVLMSCSQVHL